LTRHTEHSIPADHVLVETLTPPIQLIVLGDWPDGRSSAQIAQHIGWQTAIYDASAPSFCIEGTLQQHAIDPQTAVLIATHNLARDAHILGAVLRSDCGYVGVIGSYKRRQELARLICEQDDFELIESFEQVSCPAGLNLGGQGAQSIALSVVAEVQAQLHRRNGQPLCQRKHPIHKEDLV